MIVDLIARAEKEGVKTFDSELSAQNEWCGLIEAMVKDTLFPQTNSWWNAGNIPGKKIQMLTYAAGINNYEAQCRGKIDKWDGFVLTKA